MLMSSSMHENNKSNPPWPGGGASRVRIVMISTDNAPDGPFQQSIEKSLGVECRSGALDSMKGELYSFEKLAKSGKKLILLMLASAEAAELAAHWLHSKDAKTALQLLPNRICEIDVDENGAAIRSWNIQI
ncbi:MAG: hypothetical protein ACKVS6_03380 [Planctomycetota bacterium]